MRFQGTIELGGKSATGICVPDTVIETLGSSRRPAVRVTLGGHSYQTTAARMGGRFMVPLSAQNREAAGLAAGDQVEVDIVLDQAPREVEVPADMAAVLQRDPVVAGQFSTLSFTNRKELARWVQEPKREETRQRRLAQLAERVGALS